jgi:hypothetical protein
MPDDFINKVELARAPKKEGCDYVVTLLVKAPPDPSYVDVREYAHTEKFEGFTKRGMTFPLESFIDFAETAVKAIKRYAKEAEKAAAGCNGSGK